MNPACRICRSELIPVLDLGRQALSNRLPETATESTFSWPMCLVQCTTCGVLQLQDPPPVDEMRPRYDWLRYNEPEAHLDACAAALVAQLKARKALADVRVLGVSYKDETFLERLRQMGCGDVVSLDPVRHMGLGPACIGTESLQAEIHDRMAPAVVAKLGTYDAIVARHIFEHAYDPRAFISGLATLLRPGGLIVVEMPEVTKVLAANDYSNPWEEHVFYFTEETVRGAFAHLGFGVVGYLRFEHPLEDLQVLFVTPMAASAAVGASGSAEALRAGCQYGLNFSPFRNYLRRQLLQLREQGELACFGAGHLASMFLNGLDVADCFCFVIDDHPGKQGRFMPGSGLPIVNSASLASRRPVVCLLTLNPGSHAKIRERFSDYVAAGGRFVSAFPQTPDSVLDLVGKAPPPDLIACDSLAALYKRAPVKRLNTGDIAVLRQHCERYGLSRSRFCLHTNSEATVHEMMIYLRQDSYVRPHKHIAKSESFHVIEGALDVILFADDGTVLDHISLAAGDAAASFYYRLDTAIFHTVRVLTPYAIFHEVTNGPFRREETIEADWSPAADAATAEIATFWKRLDKRAHA